VIDRQLVIAHPSVLTERHAVAGFATSSRRRRCRSAGVIAPCSGSISLIVTPLWCVTIMALRVTFRQHNPQVERAATAQLPPTMTAARIRGRSGRACRRSCGVVGSNHKLLHLEMQEEKHAPLVAATRRRYDRVEAYAGVLHCTGSRGHAA
jgi:hypothetical protein